MSAGDVLAVVAATVLTMLVAVLTATLIALTRTLRELRETATALHDDAIPLLEAARDATPLRHGDRRNVGRAAPDVRGRHGA